MVGAGHADGPTHHDQHARRALINFGVLAPIALDHGVIKTHLDAHGAPAARYRAIVQFSLWPAQA